MRHRRAKRGLLFRHVLACSTRRTLRTWLPCLLNMSAAPDVTGLKVRTIFGFEAAVLSRKMSNTLAVGNTPWQHAYACAKATRA